MFTLSGVVRDQETGTGLSGAVVQIVDGENANQHATTAADGSCTLGGLAPHTVTVRATSHSHVSVTRGDSASGGTPMLIEFDAGAGFRAAVPV